MKVLGLEKGEEAGFSVGNLRGKIIVETKKLFVIFGYVDGYLQRLRLFKLG
jgi:hypothetical protein